MAMKQQISLITLGVRDLARAARFYEALGWRRSLRAAEGVAFFQCGALVISLFPRGDLEADAGLAPGALKSEGAFALAQNLPSDAAVDEAMERGAAAGGHVTQPARKTEWGGYAGYLQDPEGFLWEIAHNPGFALAADGSVTLPD